MFRFLLPISALFAVASGGVIDVRHAPQLDGRIVGGEDATIESFPHQVSVRYYGSHICGGSIIGSRTILTAAHCIYSLNGWYYSVEYGSARKGANNNVVNAYYQIKHEKYDSSTTDYDVALIILSSDIVFSSLAQPIPLASEAPTAGTRAIVTGWGALKENGFSSSILQQVDVEIVDSTVCSKQYNDVNAITDRMLCAGVNGGGQDACQGDSGGPLVANGELVGIVSWGVGCARPEYAGVYTNVANLHYWISSKIV